jgi:hypothetical protein
MSTMRATVPNQKVKDAIQALLQELNSMSSSDRKAAVDTIHYTITHEHRTLQQAFWSALLLAQIKYADNSHDMRNECAVKLAKAVKDAATAINLDYGLPFI